MFIQHFNHTTLRRYAVLQVVSGEKKPPFMGGFIWLLHTTLFVVLLFAIVLQDIPYNKLPAPALSTF